MSTFDDERRMQPFMDRFYQREGFTVDRRASNHKFDVALRINDSYVMLEEKYLFTKIYPRMLVELVQDIATADMGWFYFVDCKYLYWIYCNEDRISQPIAIYKIEWGRFKPFILEQIKRFEWTQMNICTKHYGITLNYPIAWDILTKNGIAKFYWYSDPILTAFYNAKGGTQKQLF